ncbi:MAG TPA: carboxymuconolactone decarboxylase family protein [Gaiellaceae bacterium]
MTRVPLVPDDALDEAAAAAFEPFRREGRRPIALYRALAHVPTLLRSYAVFARSLRHDAVIDRGLRELVILRTAQLTGSAYEWSHHVPMAAAAGVTGEQLAALGGWRESPAFGERERAVLRCTDEVHAVGVTDETFAGLERLLGRDGALEIVLTASFYQSVARTIQALDLEIEPEYRPYLEGFEREGSM